MRELSKLQSALLAVGGMMMVVGVGCVVFGILVKLFAVIFAVGSVMFAVIQMSQTYQGNSITIRRLRRIMVIGDICFILAALLMVENVFHFLFPLIATTIDGYNAYLHYIYNNWVVALLIAAILQMYSTHRISYELKKEINNE